MSTSDLNIAICELRAALRQELREEVARCHAQHSSLLRWSDLAPLVLPLGTLWLMMLVLLADHT